MSDKTISTRRSFLKGGAVAAAPLAAASPAAARELEALQARAARLQDEAAIRELHQGWLRQVNATGCRGSGLGEGVRSIAPDATGEPDTIEIGRDGLHATGRFHCAVEVQTEIAPTCTFARMAHAQGGGVVRSTERRVLEAQYVKADDGWTVAAVGFAPA